MPRAESHDDPTLYAIGEIPSSLALRFSPLLNSSRITPTAIPTSHKVAIPTTLQMGARGRAPLAQWLERWSYEP